MKKFFLVPGLLCLSLLLTGCNLNGIGTYTVNVWKCNKDRIVDCKKSSDRTFQGKINNLQFTEDELSEFKIQNLSDENRKAILGKDTDLGNMGVIEVNGREVSVSKIETSCRTYDVSIDLTYFDRATAASGEINKYLMVNRMERLKDFFKGNNDEGLKLENGDRIILRFIGLLKHGGVGTKLADVTELYLGQPCLAERANFTVKEDLGEINDMLGEINYIYILGDEEKEEGESIDSYNNLDDIMERIQKEFDERYGKMSEGTYMLDHLLTSMPTTYKENYITVILSDFLFQISPEDTAALKRKYCTKGSNFCNDSIYQFSIDNISKSYIDGYFFKSLFTKYIFDQLPSLKNLCPISDNGEKMKIYLLGIEGISGISIQDKIKDFYSNYLLKNCKIFYK